MEANLSQTSTEIAAERLQTLSVLEKLRDERLRLGQKIDDIVISIDQLLKEDRLAKPVPPLYGDLGKPDPEAAAQTDSETFTHHAGETLRADLPQRRS